MTGNILEEGKKFFDNYSQKLIKTKDSQIADYLQFKKEHCLRVAKLSVQIAEKLDLDGPDRELVEFIGLFHDLGCLTHFEKYQSFDDSKTEDHAALSISLLKEQPFFENFPEDEQQLIVQVIGDHNKAVFTSKDQRTLQLGKIVRDADKLDIWGISVSSLKRDGSFVLPSISYDLPKSPGVSEAVIKSIVSGKPVVKKDLQSVNDFKLFLMSMVFDLNFKASFQLLSEKQLIKKIYDTLPKRDEVIDIYRQIRLFIENKFVE